MKLLKGTFGVSLFYCEKICLWKMIEIPHYPEKGGTLQPAVSYIQSLCLKLHTGDWWHLPCFNTCFLSAMLSTHQESKQIQMAQEQRAYRLRSMGQIHPYSIASSQEGSSYFCKRESSTCSTQGKEWISHMVKKHNEVDAKSEIWEFISKICFALKCEPGSWNKPDNNAGDGHGIAREEHHSNFSIAWPEMSLGATGYKFVPDYV